MATGTQSVVARADADEIDQIAMFFIEGRKDDGAVFEEAAEALQGALPRRISRRRALAITGAGSAAAVVGAIGGQADGVMAAQATPSADAAPGEVTAERVAQAVERI